jgi:phospholipase/carboxylesterase
MPLTTDFIPATQPGSPHLMLVLHGLGDSMEGYRWLPGVMNLPWLNYLLVNAPDEYYGGFSWFPYPGERGPGIKRSRELLTELLAAQCEQGFAAADTFLFGFSQGCLMSVEVAVRFPRRLAGVVGISGWVDDPAGLLREQSAAAPEQRFLITHGLFDPLIPFAGAKSCFAVLKQGGLDLEWHEYPKEHTIYGESEMRVIREFVSRAAGDRDRM